MQNVLIIGSGGREHALAWKIAQSPNIGQLFVAPGNPGTQEVACNVDIPANRIEDLILFSQKARIDLTIVGPDEPLALGIVDAFQGQGLKIFGPSRMAAELEWSKSFAKNLMNDIGLKTARCAIFSNLRLAENYIMQRDFPMVIKEDGLALGKGVHICFSLDAAENALAKVFSGQNKKVIIEDYLNGQELSAHALCSNASHDLWPLAKDHKRIFDNNLGPNTGGMGSIVPVPTSIGLAQIDEETVVPILRALQEKKREFVGCLFPGVMANRDGVYVLEFNARFGDPETQSYMRILESDLLEVINACLGGDIENMKAKWSKKYAVCVVLASRGYPESSEKGVPIFGLDEARKIPNIVIFHAGTKMENGQLCTNGGRVLGISAVGQTLHEARSLAYQAISRIKFDGMQYRSDIGNGYGAL